ncbi:hypothetical protein CYY_002804 [Polysphondylium violaceum]|uniref:SPX domain-containing protein n=1 Tax=Polysphondylium violaceum TaxID=133409 RepID=A0A8J4V1X0_9MYCE|nr:hypothetical protein CYY_002804 [Polysphondylium violaceum]
MKFGKKLRYECVSEWKNKYIAYGKLKKYLRFLFQSQFRSREERELMHLKLNGTLNPNDGDPQEQLPEQHLQSDSVGDYDEKTPLMDRVDINNNNNNNSHGSFQSINGSNGSSSNDNNNNNNFTPIQREKMFMAKIDEELKKINDFFSTTEKDLILHYNKLTEHCSIILKDNNPSPKVLKTLQRGFLELYKGLTMVENYVTLNFTGFFKIFKKYDRLAGTCLKEDQKERIESQLFYQSKVWRNMKEDIELLYCKIFKIDKIELAKKKLSPVGESTTVTYHMLKLGFAIGISFAILIFIIILFTSPTVGQPDWSRFVSTIPIFRGVALPILAAWFWGFNVYIWDRARVNYILIFGLDPRTSVCHRRIWKTASFLTAIWLTTFLLFCGTIMGNFRIGNIPAQVYPLALVVFFLIVVFFPFRFFHRKSRMLLFVTLGNVLMTPFGSTKFRALYLGDVLTSMVKTIFDWEYTACYFITGDWERNDGQRCNKVNSIALPIISGLPLLWRFMQCIIRYRETGNKIHIGNASKYAVGFSVVLFSALNGNYQNYEAWTPARILWCICFILATIYMYCWDVVVDWGFMWLGTPRPLLRHSLMYKKHLWSYYYILFSNLILRFAWTLTITPIEINIGINNELFVTIFATIELFRRFSWSIFRVENEHICNSIQFHAFDFSDAPWNSEIPKVPQPNTILPISNTHFKEPHNSISTFQDDEFSIWKKSSKQYYSISIIEKIKNKFNKKK